MFWSGIRYRSIKALTHQCKRGGVAPANYISESSKTSSSRVLESYISFNQNELYGVVRCYAAPVLANQPTPEPKEEKKTRLNQDISADFVRLVFSDGHEVVSRHEALKRARHLKLDLVEVDRAATPPVCKIMDYHREKYKYKQNLKERMKSKAQGSLRKGAGKEVRFAAKTEQKDLETKANQVKKLMEKGFRVKCMATGKEDGVDLGGLLARLLALIEDVTIIESGPFAEKTQAYAIVRHIKFGLPKKSGKKKLKTPTPPSTIESEPKETEEKELEDGTESESESDSESEEFNPSQVETPYIQSRPTRPEINDNRYGGGRNQGRTNIPPTQDNAPKVSPPRVSGPQVGGDRYGGGRAQVQVPRGPTQVGEDRYGGGRGRVQVPRGPTQVVEDRYSGQVQPTKPLEKTPDNTSKPSSTSTRQQGPPQPQRSSYGIFSAPKQAATEQGNKGRPSNPEGRQSDNSDDRTRTRRN